MRETALFVGWGRTHPGREIAALETFHEWTGILEQLSGQGIEPEREPYRVREGGSRICFVRDPDEYRVELIERSVAR